MGTFVEQNSFSGKLLKFLGFLSRARACGHGALESDACIKTRRDIEIEIAENFNSWAPIRHSSRVQVLSWGFMSLFVSTENAAKEVPLTARRPDVRARGLVTRGPCGNSLSFHLTPSVFQGFKSSHVVLVPREKISSLKL